MRQKHDRIHQERAVPCCELGFAIHPEYRKQGYAYEAVSHLMETLFENTDAEMFLAGHFPHNEASKALIQKLGFVCEGHRRKALRHEVLGPIDLIYYYKEKTV